MTKLDCSVTNCMFNKEKVCCKDNIRVGGKDARVVSETCCESFRERRDGVTSSADSIPAKGTDIACDATTCSYNEECKCHAGRIQMSGHGACNCDETACSTFKCECK